MDRRREGRGFKVPAGFAAAFSALHVQQGKHTLTVCIVIDECKCDSARRCTNIALTLAANATFRLLGSTETEAKSNLLLTSFSNELLSQCRHLCLLAGRAGVKSVIDMFAALK